MAVLTTWDPLVGSIVLRNAHGKPISVTRASITLTAKNLFEKNGLQVLESNVKPSKRHSERQSKRWLMQLKLEPSLLQMFSPKREKETSSPKLTLYHLSERTLEQLQNGTWINEYTTYNKGGGEIQ